jgi:protein-tyrosine-phosphatase
MAMGFFGHLAGDRAHAYSGGSEPAEQVNPSAIAAMAEKGIDIGAEQPKRWTDAMIEAADVVVTMGGGDTCRCYRDAATKSGSCPTLPASHWRRCGRFETRSNSASAHY